MESPRFNLKQTKKTVTKALKHQLATFKKKGLASLISLATAC
ncbi:hypothetical protein [Limosilactobacillus albertensis]|nr:hypothetical protein [Limosilactobacillus albertensis]